MIYQGDCLDIMPTLEPDLVDSIVTDPPYGLSFMGKDWDHGIPGVPFWIEAILVAKPGAFLLAFGGTRTFHRLTCAIEDAGWEIRDTIMWVYGGGFPKSHDVSKAIDKAEGAKRRVIGERWEFAHDGCDREGPHESRPSQQVPHGDSWHLPVTAPATDAAREWDGWGTGLKPAWEPIIVARKPLEGTVVQNVLKWGTGAMNIDGCRVELAKYDRDEYIPNRCSWKKGINYSQPEDNRNKTSVDFAHGRKEPHQVIKPQGRWPANLIHDGSLEVLSEFAKGGNRRSGGIGILKKDGFSPGDHLSNPGGRIVGNFYNDTGSAARFFYCAKASKAERGEGNNHPTVKPLSLIQYLITLVTPPGGIVLDPFAGSGSMGVAAINTGHPFILIEKDAGYCEIIRQRINNHQPLLMAMG
jgi:site-specific DNA-methyltransferase (adenine-specific)